MLCSCSAGLCVCTPLRHEISLLYGLQERGEAYLLPTSRLCGTGVKSVNKSMWNMYKCLKACSALFAGCAVFFQRTPCHHLPSHNAAWSASVRLPRSSRPGQAHSACAMALDGWIDCRLWSQTTWCGYRSACCWPQTVLCSWASQ